MISYSSFIGLEKYVQSQKDLIFRFFLIFEFTKERIKISKRFWHHSMCFRIMHIVQKFQFCIPFSSVVKLKNKNKKGKRRRVFSDFFKVTYLNELISYKLHIYVKIMLVILFITFIKLLWFSKKSRVRFSHFKTWVFLSFLLMFSLVYRFYLLNVGFNWK